jgi:adenosine deaminase
MRARTLPRRTSPRVSTSSGCERIDHGYRVLGDPEVVKRTRDEGIAFTVCPTATALCYFDAGDLTTHPIRKMASGSR